MAIFDPVGLYLDVAYGLVKILGGIFTILLNTHKAFVLSTSPLSGILELDETGITEKLGVS